MPMIAVSGIWPLMSSSFLRKSGVSWIYEGASETRGLMWWSTKREMFSVGEPFPERMGRPGLPGL